MTYHDRLLALAAVPDAQAANSLIPDVENWAKLLKDARNGVAHAAKTATGPAGLAKIASLQYSLTEVTYALLSIVLMAELQLPAEIQQRAAWIQDFVIAANHFAEDSKHPMAV